jgi:hypothetical protein
MQKKTLLVSLSLLFAFSINSQNNSDNFWSPINQSSIRSAGKRQIIPQKCVAFELIGNELKTKLYLDEELPF